tara:strand:- start:129 stop:509 length:381 start_codon:yes stop_codon:yes gene_type:complete
MNGDKKKTLNDFLESDSLKTFGEKSADSDALMEAFRQREENKLQRLLETGVPDTLFSIGNIDTSLSFEDKWEKLIEEGNERKQADMESDEIVHSFERDGQWYDFNQSQLDSLMKGTLEELPLRMEK